MSMNFDEMVASRSTGSSGSPGSPGKRALELRKRPEFVVAGLPSVSLLPGEFRDAERVKTVRRALAGAVVVAIVIAGGAIAGASMLASNAQAQLNAETARSETLLHQLSRLSDVQKLQQGIALGDAAVSVGQSAEVDWQSQIDAIEAGMPTGYAVQSIAADSANALNAYQQGTTPLEMPRAASLTFTITAKSVTQLPTWLRELRSVPAYADATASFSNDDTSGYSIALTVHLSAKALVHAKAAK